MLPKIHNYNTENGGTKCYSRRNKKTHEKTKLTTDGQESKKQTLVNQEKIALERQYFRKFLVKMYFRVIINISCISHTFAKTKINCGKYENEHGYFPSPAAYTRAMDSKDRLAEIAR